MFSGYGRYVDVQLRVNYFFLSLNRLYKIVICMKILKSKKQSLPKILDDFGFDLRLKFLFGKATPHLEGTKTMWAGNDLAIRGRPFVGGWHLHQPVASVGELGLKVLYIYIGIFWGFVPEMCVFFLDVKSFELACFHELKHCILKAQHTNGVVQLRSHIAEEFPLFFTCHIQAVLLPQGKQHFHNSNRHPFFCPDKYGDLQLKAAKAEQARQSRAVGLFSVDMSDTVPPWSWTANSHLKNG